MAQTLNYTLTPESGLFDLDREDEIIETFVDAGFNCYVEYLGTQFYIIFDELYVTLDEMLSGYDNDGIMLILQQIEDNLVSN